MKIFVDKWIEQRIHIGLVKYKTRMFYIHITQPKLWQRGLRFELVIRLGKWSLDIANYCIGGDKVERISKQRRSIRHDEAAQTI